MKKITCEMCGSTEFVKKDGFMECQGCGTKYSIEDAKKLFVEGKIDVTGSIVKVDTSSELKNLYELARRAKMDGNIENAQKYYDQIVIKDPSSWEAYFYSTYYQSMNIKISQIRSNAIRMTYCEETVLNLIKDNVTNPEEREKAIDEVADRLISIATMMFNAAIDCYDGIRYEFKSQYDKKTLKNCCATMDIVLNYGDYLVKFFGDKYEDIAVSCWDAGITMNDKLGQYFKLKDKSLWLNYENKIRKYLGEDEFEDLSQTSTVDTSSGCYVATAIYGSYDCPQVWTLRRYRDYNLAESWYGRVFIRTYYVISPTFVKWFGNTEWFKKIWRKKLDRIVKNLQDKGYESTYYVDRDWR